MSDIWAKLSDHYAATRERPISSLFEDAARFKAFSACSEGLLLDFSKTNLDTTTRDLLLELAKQSGVAARRDAMFRGDRINTTEDRAVLHTALRSSATTPLLVDGEDIRADIRATRATMAKFARDIRANGQFSDVINIGIGGSDLGPAMATPALAPYHDGPRCHFVSNVDGAHISDVLKRCEAARTLVIIASKTFTTTETMTNARTALDWLEVALGDKARDHLAAVSSAVEKTAGFGITPDRVFGFGDYVGGRYSLWGPVGLSIMLAIGPERFDEFLSGAEAMDRHFQSAPLDKNLPVLLALAGIWHRNICGYQTRAVLPYDQRLSRLPAYLQQLDMESNGKRISLDGTPVSHASGPVVWGEPGTNGQHAFYQLLHQGTDVIPAEFLIAAEGHEPHLAHQHDLLKANCLAQSEALMNGRSIEAAREIARAGGATGVRLDQLAQHRSFPGNRPSVTLVYPKLTPFALGQIIALYEHRVFVEGTIWNINSFDQWGVELGKELANGLLPLVQGGDSAGKDPSTQGLLAALCKKG